MDGTDGKINEEINPTIDEEEVKNDFLKLGDPNCKYSVMKDYKVMDQAQSEMFFSMVFASQQANYKYITLEQLREIDETAHFFINALDLRIQAFKLDVKYDPLAVLWFTEVVGSVMVILIDYLNAYGNTGTINCETLSNIYPMGFYNDNAFEKRIDAIKADQILPEEERKILYSHIY